VAEVDVNGSSVGNGGAGAVHQINISQGGVPKLPVPEAVVTMDGRACAQRRHEVGALACFWLPGEQSTSIDPPNKEFPMSEVVYISFVRIEQDRRPNRRAFLPATPDPVRFGVHGAVAEHYGVSPEEEHATTLDYVVAAAVG
jgi:hypothetical protein